MHYDQLTGEERAALFALVAAARPLTNNELQERAGLRIDGSVRRRLNNMKLVESPKQGRAYVHELTDAGWRWCEDELSVPPPAGSQRIERSLYGMLASFAQYMRTAGLSLADVLRPEQEPAIGNAPQPQEPIETVDVETVILSAYRALATEPAQFIKLADLRGRLADAPRTEIDLALNQMYRLQRINLIPQSSPRALSAEDRAAAIVVGGETKHLMAEVLR